MNPAAGTTRAYAGIGSRETPGDVLSLMADVARMLAEQGWTLRSGGAGGADTAFELATPLAQQEIYLPWKGFSGRDGIIATSLPSFARAEEIARAHHPAAANTTAWARIHKLMARNALQVLGGNLQTPSAFVMCWAMKSRLDPEGRVIDVAGGTGLAVRIAATHSIPVYNLEMPAHRQRVEQRLAAHRTAMARPDATSQAPRARP